MTASIRYLAIGDSLTAGFGVPTGFGFADRVREHAQRVLGTPVVLDNAGVSGTTSGDMLADLLRDASLQERVREADLITITVGGNDLLDAAKQFYLDQDTQHLMQSLKTCHRHLAKWIKTVRAQKRARGSSRYAIRLADLYNPIPFFPESIEWVERFNRMYRRFEAVDLRVADVYDSFIGREESLLSDDLIHPNQAGYAIMAECVNALGYAPLG